MTQDYRQHMEDFNLVDHAVFTAYISDLGKLCDQLIVDNWQIIGIDKGLYQIEDSPGHYCAVTKFSVTAKRKARFD